jgi:SAM-dependent methyltransferase
MPIPVLPRGRPVCQPFGMAFTGEVATAYARCRRGFPPAAVDLWLKGWTCPPMRFVLDLGCGTGQLTVPLAGLRGGQLVERLRLAEVRSGAPAPTSRVGPVIEERHRSWAR